MQYDIIPPLDHIDVFQDKRKASQDFPRCEDTGNSPKELGFIPEPQFNNWGFCRDSSTKCIGDVLKDSHPGSPTSLFSSMNNSESDSDFEVRPTPNPTSFLLFLRSNSKDVSMLLIFLFIRQV